jgi:hypothetical protein
MKRYENLYQTDLFDTEKLFRDISAKNDTPVISSFQLSRAELKEALLGLWAHHKYSGNNKYFIKFELITRNDQVVFKTKNAERYVSSKPVGFCKATFHYQDMLMAMGTSRKKDVSFIVQERVLIVNGVRISAEVSAYDPSNDIARNTPTLEQLSETSVTVDPYAPDVDKYRFTKDGKRGFMRSQIFSDAQMAEHYLKKYGIGFFEIQDFIDSFLMNKKS